MDRQPVYAAECRALTVAPLSAPGSPYGNLSATIRTRSYTVPASADGFPITVVEYYSRAADGDDAQATTTAVVYIHDGQPGRQRGAVRAASSRPTRACPAASPSSRLATG